MSRDIHTTAAGRQSRIRSIASTYNASLESVLHAADERWKHLLGYQSVLSKDWQPDMDSHVILAACQSDQLAMEAMGTEGFGGVFTKELVRVLGSTNCKEETTYDDLIRLLNQLPHQTPLVAGTRRFKPIVCRASPRFWAVLIGIDAYYTGYAWRGCVSDALLIKSYLTDDLGVPENRIQCLLSPKYPNSDDPKSTPSRANIIDMLYSLASNPEIERGDSIIVYFAGVGSYCHCSEYPHKVKCPTGFCLTEFLCPIDYGTQDASGQQIPGISDRELNSLFALICRAKGDKITFIVDSDYGSAMSRDQRPGTPSAAWTYADVEGMLHAADERWKHFPGYRSVLSKDWRPNMDSHVILAACWRATVMEVTVRTAKFGGVFTKELVRVLRSTDCKEETTYADLIQLLNDLPFQTPLVDGTRIFERLWYTQSQ